MKVMNCRKLNIPWYVSLGNSLLWITRWNMVLVNKKWELRGNKDGWKHSYIIESSSKTIEEIDKENMKILKDW